MRCGLLFIGFLSWLPSCLSETQLRREDIVTLGDMLKGRNGYGQKLNGREIRTPWTTILNGLLRSQNFASVAASIPCDIVNTLETSAEEAEQFVREIQAGQVPTIIETLPSEIVDAFSSIFNVALSLPEAIWSTAENVVDGVAGIFDSIVDGSIVSELPEAIADAWEDITEGFADAWDGLTGFFECLFDDCPEPTAGGCASGVPAASAAPINYSNSSVAYSYEWALSSAVAAASSVAYVQATASASSLQPAALGTSIVYVQPTDSATPSSQVVPGAAMRAAESHGLTWMAAGMIVIGGLVLWL